MSTPAPQPAENVCKTSPDSTDVNVSASDLPALPKQASRPQTARASTTTMGSMSNLASTNIVAVTAERDALARSIVALTDEKRGLVERMNSSERAIQSFMDLLSRAVGDADDTANLQSVAKTVIQSVLAILPNLKVETPSTDTYAASPSTQAMQNFLSTNGSKKTLPTLHVDGGAIPAAVLDIFPVFRDFPAEVREDLVFAAYELRRRQGQGIVRIGDVGAEMFFVMRGEVCIMDGDSEVSSLGSNTFFGELGVLFNTTRTASVQAKTDCVLIVLTKQKIEQAVSNYPDLQQKLRHMADEKGTWWTTQKYRPFGNKFGGEFVLDVARRNLRKVSLFADADDTFLDKLSLKMQSIVYKPADLIIEKDSLSDAIFFVVSGTVHVLGDDAVTVHAQMSSGSFFGEVGVLLHVRRTASIVAKDECSVLKLLKADVDELCLSNVEMKRRIEEVANERYHLFMGRSHSQLDASSATARANDEQRSISTNGIPEQFHVEMNIQNLKKLELFMECEEHIVDELALKMTQKTWNANDRIINCGDNADGMYFIAIGEINIISEFGQLLDFGKIEYVGEVAILEDVPRTATIEAITEVSTFELKRQDVKDCIAKYPAFAKHIEETARKRLQSYLMRNVLA
ncbi:hypothetical protein SmJEL517_g04539 [Synchytrium microbalum]|uniref:Cyclic nucleotide-binding domain-containing protein n=1 Tax=Synchytrium microbalum TaxID=1806994 RepID=A0A507BZ22_9FUNG|nr:uncharacterized protein SmJEL517_g04539 [Synchytrium microbalum]TPX32358.1 hypothetical protein SmJEL517_g04539 [Synchytrium microbalum]